MHSESTMLEFLSRVLLTLGSFYIFFFSKVGSYFIYYLGTLLDIYFLFANPHTLFYWFLL